MTEKRKLRAGLRTNTPSVKTAVKKPKTPKVVKTIVEETAETTETATNE